jgi:hypothetical protein
MKELNLKNTNPLSHEFDLSMGETYMIYTDCTGTKGHVVAQ